MTTKEIKSPAAFRKEQWKMLFITMFCYLFFYTGRQNFGWAAKGLAAELGVSFEQVGWISFSMLMGYAAGQLVNGNLADRMDPRKMIFVGGIFSVAANFSISFMSSYPIILLLWALNGYFQSMAWAAGSKLISNWWGQEERGMAFGYYTMAAGSSSVLTYVLAIILVQENSSWRTLFRYPVLLLFGAVILFYLIARGKPLDKGFINSVMGQTQPAKEETHWIQRYRSVFANKRFMLTSLAIGFQSMARYGLIFWVPVHFLGANYESQPGSVWVTLAMPVGMAIGALSFGYISDLVFKRNRPASIRAGMLISALIALAIYFTPVHQGAIVAVLMVLSGFFVYGPQANFWPMSPELLGDEYVGTGVGVMNMFAYIFAAFGEPLFGKIIDQTHNTSLVFPVVALISGLCALVISFVNPHKKIKNSSIFSTNLTKEQQDAIY